MVFLISFTSRVLLFPPLRPSLPLSRSSSLRRHSLTVCSTMLTCVFSFRDVSVCFHTFPSVSLFSDSRMPYTRIHILTFPSRSRFFLWSCPVRVRADGFLSIASSSFHYAFMRLSYTLRFQEFLLALLQQLSLSSAIPPTIDCALPSLIDSPVVRFFRSSLVVSLCIFFFLSPHSVPSLVLRSPASCSISQAIVCCGNCTMSVEAETPDTGFSLQLSIEGCGASVADCVAHYFGQSALPDYKCRDCGVHGLCSSTIKIRRPPRVLVVQLKVFHLFL
jgi:hypothetical protein